MKKDKNMLMAKRIAEEVASLGGRAYYVGGYVRDRLLGRETKDIDIEVHGISPEILNAILDDLGGKVVKGASFGVYGLSHYDLDIAMPRKEKAIGRGHRDFDVYVDPFIGTQKAASRRDFTINALMQDILTDEIIDHFGGSENLKHHRLKHVCTETFTEDPLRVLRAAQFAARFDFEVDPETMALCSTMDLSQLSKERIMGELEKALLKSSKPSVFFEILCTMDQLHHWFPELEALNGLKQDARHHPEGNVWQHTMKVLDEAASLRDKAHHPLWFMLSALCHDYGKVLTTEEKDGRIHAYGHEEAGLPLVKQSIERLTNERELKRMVLNMVCLHMKPALLINNHAKTKAYMKLFDEAYCPEDLLLLAEADHLSRWGTPEERDQLEISYSSVERVLKAQYEDYKSLMAKPYVQGKDLMDAGVPMGAVYSEALAYAHKLRLAGVEKESALKQTLGFVRRFTQKQK